MGSAAAEVTVAIERTLSSWTARSTSMCQRASRTASKRETRPTSMNLVMLKRQCSGPVAVTSVQSPVFFSGGPGAPKVGMLRYLGTCNVTTHRYLHRYKLETNRRTHSSSLHFRFPSSRSRMLAIVDQQIFLSFTNQRGGRDKIQPSRPLGNPLHNTEGSLLPIHAHPPRGAIILMAWLNKGDLTE